MQRILKSYLKRLTNLTNRNKSLLLLALQQRQFIDLQDLDFLHGKPAFDIIEQLISRKSTIPLFPVHDPRHEKLNQASRQFRQIQRSARFIEEESGAVDLYIGYPFIRGKFSDGTLVRCPLLFFPVSLEIENNKWQLKERDENVVINKNFLLAYNYFNTIIIPDTLLDMDFGDFSKESLVFRTELYEWLKTTPLAINFNQDVIRTNQLIPFDNFNKSRFEENHKTGELKLFPEAVLGIFPQAGSYLAPDYQQLIAENAFESIEEFLLTKTNQAKTGNIREENTFVPFSIDASQEKALQMVKEGQSIVVQGPPGTGKSQLIANLVCDYTARGKKVLLVCQKRAALDVVYQRLSQLGMQDFIALVHDFRHDRKSLYEQINNQIERLDTYKQQNQNLDAVYLDREFSQQSRKINKLTSELEEFKKALFDESECGLSVKELYLTSFPDSSHIGLKKEYKYFHFSVNTAEFLRKLQFFEEYSVKTEADEYVWKNRVSFHHFQRSDLEGIIELITEIPAFQETLSKKLAVFLGKKLSFTQAEKLSDERKIWFELSESLKNEAQWQIFLNFIEKVPKEKHDASWFQNKEKQLLKYFAGAGIEETLNKSELTTIELLLKEAMKAEESFVTWQFWKLFNKQKQPLLAVLEKNRMIPEKKDFLLLLEKIQNRFKLEELLEEMREHNEVHRPYEAEYLQRWFENHRQALKARKIAKKSDFFKREMPLTESDLVNFQQKVYKLFSLLQEADTTCKTWNKYLTDKQIEKILNEKADNETWIAVLKEDFDELTEMDRIKNSMSNVEKNVCEKLQEKQKKYDSITLVQLFENSIRLAWIDHIEEKYPILTAVSTQKMSQIETELQESVEQKARLSRNILLMRLRENVFRAVELNRLKNIVTYRDLKHQVAKKRNIWTIRKLMAAFSEELFRLIPCWMASPETVSAITPIFSQSPDEETGLSFDLVIFDEASQCFAENGIPAMFRGKQVVVTGDSRQLTPNDLYQVRFDNEEEETPELEVESLLDLSARFFPQVQLTGHYRSKSLDLIDFSNQYFYKNTLQLLPDRYAINGYEPAISFIKTEGIWENGTNVTEAEKVIQLVAELLKTQPDKETGIVTFNYKQQNLIQDLLEAYAINHQINLPESLFVKNIENVQGDERDIIIFSIGYAADKNGKVALQFGSLNLQGGENRLNVAVTRAREKIFVISSILPQQLSTENTAYEGPKLLKKYLEYALEVSENRYKPHPLPAKALSGNSLLKNKLLLMQDNLFAELPFADLTLKNEQEYEALVLTDDDLYFQSLSAKDAHVYNPVMLRQKNWAFQRFYSRQFWKDAQKLKDKLKKI